MAETITLSPATLDEAVTPEVALPIDATLPLTQSQVQESLLEEQRRRATRIARPAPSPMAPLSPQQEQGMEEGVPLDISTGIPTWDRIKLEFHRTQRDQLRYLQQKYPESRIRLNPQGRWVVRVQDKENQGQVEDVVVDPRGTEVGDLGKVVAAVPEMVGEVASLLGRKISPGFWGALRTAVTSATSGQIVGGTIDAIIRGAEGATVDPQEIAKSRSLLGGLNVGLGLTAGGIMKAFTALRTPFASQGVDQLNFREAQEALRPLLGDIPATPAQLTGSVFLGNVEEFLRKRPAGARPFEGLAGQTEQSFTRLQNVALGLAPDTPPAVRDALIPTPEATGIGALTTLRGEVGATEFPVERARFQTIRTGTQELEQALGVNRASKVNVPILGNRLREMAVSQRDLFKQVDSQYYDRFYNHPLALEKNMNVRTMATHMKKVRDELPSKTEITEIASPVLDPFGRPILSTIEGKVPLKEFVPPGVLKRLDALVGLKGEKMAINELKQMRTDVFNAIMEGEAIPGVTTGYLKKIQSELTAAIDDGLKQINDPSLTAAWQDATTYHRQNVDRFLDQPIARMFKTERQAGAIGDIELVELIRKGGPEARDTYNSFKRFYGNAPEFQALQKSIRDDIFHRSYTPMYEAIDGKKFVDSLKAFTDENPEIAADVFGPVAKEISDIGATIGVAQGKIDYKDLQNALSTPTRSALFLSDLISAENKKAQKYTNDLISRVAKGQIDAEDIVPSEFVGRFVSKAQPVDIEGVMKILDEKNPVAAQAVRQTTVFDILQEATPTGGKFATPYAVRGTLLEPTAVDLHKIITDPQRRPKIEAVIGKSGLSTLDNYVKLIAPTEKRQRGMAAMGGLSAGTQMAQLLSFGLARYAGAAARNWFESAIITSPMFRNWVSNTVIPPERAALLANVAIASAPFIATTLSTFGEEAGAEILSDLKQGINGFQRELEQRFPAVQQEQPAGLQINLSPATLEP